ncbi:hypothetical protein OSB04_011523 [Centaurea solstitialis]|uniref:Zinc finger PMZ-type domain-containing protein n=1 Tax=Centaurea solstitialis TaxID=347529 RepID=A0AA38WP74_9ASTR|nr:hypothetical protein OSB04_011523 [Centaurea solstitialis]
MNMSQRTCDCRQWHMSGLPYGHAIAVGKAINVRDVSSLVHVPYFKTEHYKTTYSGVINPVGPLETWLSPDVPLSTVLLPIVKKRRVGRPSLNARRPSRGEGSTLRRCPRCGDNTKTIHVLEAMERKSTKKGEKAWKLDKLNSESISRPRRFKSGAAK